MTTMLIFQPVSSGNILKGLVIIIIFHEERIRKLGIKFKSATEKN